MRVKDRLETIGDTLGASFSTCFPKKRIINTFQRRQSTGGSRNRSAVSRYPDRRARNSAHPVHYKQQLNLIIKCMAALEEPMLTSQAAKGGSCTQGRVNRGRYNHYLLHSAAATSLQQGQGVGNLHLNRTDRLEGVGGESGGWPPQTAMFRKSH